jgi:hypothetical protein
MDDANQKERSAYRFTLHQMVKLEAEIERLVLDLSAFNTEVFTRLGPPPSAFPPPQP